MIDFDFSTDLKPDKGRLLVAEPFLDDTYFKRAVVLLCDYNAQGAFGLVLNHYLDLQISEMIEGLPEISSKLSIGGPVSTSNVYYIHTLGEMVDGSVHVIDDIYMGGDFDDIKQQLLLGQAQPEQIRFFLGYSGWSALQLDDEMEEKAWIVANTKSSEIMNTSLDGLWKTALERQGKKFRLMSDFPEDFRLN